MDFLDEKMTEWTETGYDWVDLCPPPNWNKPVFSSISAKVVAIVAPS